MHEQDTVVLDLPSGGRHRLQASSLRRAVSRMSLGAAAVVLTIGLGVVAAVATGLTNVPTVDLGGMPAPSTGAHAGPTSPRAGSIAVGPTAEPAAASDVADPDVAAEEPASAPVEGAPPAPVADPAPVAGAESPPVSTVSPGDPCSSEGSAAVTSGGKPTVCMRRGDGRTRWRVS